MYFSELIDKKLIYIFSQNNYHNYENIYSDIIKDNFLVNFKYI